LDSLPESFDFVLLLNPKTVVLGPFYTPNFEDPALFL
jgi:hypothetical protein